LAETGPHPWELAWKEGRWQELSPPLPAVSEFAEYLKQVGSKTVLDLGCGAGRHAIFLARAGFQVTGLDVSETALAELHGRLAKAGLANVSLVKHEMSELPFIDGSFDALVSTNVLHHGRGSEIKRALSEVHRVIKRNGVAFVVTLSKKDFRYGHGKRLEPDTYLFTEGDEQGIVHHFFSEEELLSYFGQFDVLFLEEELIPVGRGSRAHFHLRLKKQ
jgi:ubiquinone/menaquinone biosynthesis C-methylase UbiE